jgi:TRAP-type C4-dicarboxylate transport system permease small subunit
MPGLFTPYQSSAVLRNAMSQEHESLWLGPLRKPIRILMILNILATGVLIFWILLSTRYFGAGIGMKQFLSPSEIPLVMLTMVVATATLLISSIYLSDTRGSIEIRPSGFFDIVSLICSRLSMIGISVLVFVMFYEVVSRYLFEKPTLWANELSLWIAGFLFLFASLYAMQQRSHIRIYVIYDYFPRGLQKAADVISVSLIWVFTGLLIWGGYNEALAKFNRWETFGTAWDPPLPATIKPAILIILSMAAIQALSNLIADWNKPPEHHSAADDIDAAEIAKIRKSIEG